MIPANGAASESAREQSSAVIASTPQTGKKSRMAELRERMGLSDTNSNLPAYSAEDAPDGLHDRVALTEITPVRGWQDVFFLDDRQLWTIRCRFCWCDYVIRGQEVLKEHWRHMPTTDRSALIVGIQTNVRGIEDGAGAGATAVRTWIASVGFSMNLLDGGDLNVVSAAILAREEDRLVYKRVEAAERDKEIRLRLASDLERGRKQLGLALKRQEQERSLERSAGPSSLCPHCGADGQLYRICKRCRRVR